MIPRRILTALLAAALTAGCQPPPVQMTPSQAAQMKNLTSDLVPRCIGRYLIDLPRSFVVNPVARAVIEGITIETEPMSRNEFEAYLVNREAQLRSAHMDGAPGTPFLKRVEANAHVEVGRIFNRAEHTGAPGFARTLELLAWKDGVRFSMTLNATDGTDLKVDPEMIGTVFEESERRTVEKYKGINEVPQKLAHLIGVFQRTSGRADHEIPTGPGVCIRHGFIQGPATDQEWIDLNYYLSTAEDVSFTFHYLSHIGPQSDTLLQRGGSIEPALKRVDGRTLRKGVRETNNLRPEEWLMERQVDPGVKDYHFTLELNSESGNALEPLLVIDFDSGSRIPHPERSLEEEATLKPIQKATLGEAESIALWDAVLPTLRRRPNAF